MDPGTRIPKTAMQSRENFLRWGRANGYENGMSIIIDGLLAPPGQVVRPMRDSDRQKSEERQKELGNSEKVGTRRVAYWQAPSGDEE
jgi:hypothetical protein